MKFKYYLRGLGIGILVTVIILAISSAFHKNEISDDEVIARAKKLGMVMAEQEDNKIPEGQDSEADISSADDGSQELTGDSAQDVPSGNTQVIQTEFTVEVGESSNQVAQKLADLGLVDDAAAFNQYMVDNGYDERVRAGTIIIPQDSDYEMLVQLLTGKTAE